MKMSPITKCAFIILGLVIGSLGLKEVVGGLSASSWPSTQGEILSSDIKYYSNSKGHTYGASVTYSYTVDKRFYRSNQISFGSYSGSYSHAQEVLNRYPKGALVPVFYDKSSPDNAVLEKGVGFGAYIALYGGIIFCLAPWGLSYFWKRFEQNPSLPL